MPGIPVPGALLRPINPNQQQQIQNENAMIRDQQAQANLKSRLPNAQDMSNSAMSNIKDMQQFLSNRGYNVTVDGIRGPQTNAAVAAFHNHIAPAQFNARFRPQHPTNGKFVPTNTSVAPVKPTGGVNKPDTRFTSGSGGSNNGAQDSTSAFDPQAYAQSAANAQYDPSIHDLTNQINSAGAQNIVNQKALQDYYNQMQSLINGQLSGVQAQGDQGGKDYAAALGNVAQLFGGAQAPQVGAVASQGADALSAVNQAQQDYLKNLAPLLQAQGAQGAADLAGAYTQQRNSLHSQLQSQQQAKGQTYAQDYQQGLQNQAQMQQNEQALKDAQALLPYQIQSAKAQAAADATNATDAPAINQAKINQANSIIQKNMAEAKAALAKGASFAPGSKDRQTLVKSLYSSMVNSNGTAIIGNPLQAQRALYTQAVAYGLLDPNGQESKPGVATMLKAVLQNVLASTPTWRAAGWQWNGSTFVQTKK